jgi:hypothetical protein
MESESPIKKEYKKLQKKHSLPTFEKLDENFHVSKIGEKDLSFLAREIRGSMNEKFSAYLALFENLLSPAGPPMFVFSLLRGISPGDKEKVKEIYTILAKSQLDIMKLDTVYSEEKEIEFINNSYEKWQDLKLEIMQLIENFESIFGNENSERTKGYLG